MNIHLMNSIRLYKTLSTKTFRVLDQRMWKAETMNMTFFFVIHKFYSYIKFLNIFTLIMLIRSFALGPIIPLALL